MTSMADVIWIKAIWLEACDAVQSSLRGTAQAVVMCTEATMTP